MYGLFITKTPEDKYFTNLEEVFNVLGNVAMEYNWLLTDYDCNIYPSDKIPANGQFVWISGDELFRILKKQKIQLIWGVATAYTKDITLDEVLQHPLPVAEEYYGFRNPEITMQNPLSNIEMISIDCTFLVVIAKSAEYITKLSDKYSNAVDFVEYSRSFRNKRVNPS